MLFKTSVCSLAIILALFCLIGTKQYGRAKVIGERTSVAGYNNVIIPLGKALASLERAYETHDPQMQYLNIDPHRDSLRSDPRFTALVRRVGLTQ